MTVHQKPLPYEIENPPPGVRLNFPDAAVRLGITVAQMAQAAGISNTAMCRLMTNDWPVRTDPQAIYSALIELFEARGATPEEVVCMFHARINSQRRRAIEAITPADHKPRRRKGAAVAQPQQEDETMLLSKQTMSRATKQAFGLFRNPFDSELQPSDDIFVNSDVAYAREACLQAALNGSFVGLVGESGSGKTTTVQNLEETLLRDRKPVIVIRPVILAMSEGKPIKAGDVLDSIIRTLDPTATIKQRIDGRTTQARRLMEAGVDAGSLHLLLIEEAHSMDDTAFKLLKRLHEMRLGRRPLLGILLVGQPELKAKLDPKRAAVREVSQRCELVELLPLDNDVKAYLTHLAKGANVDLAKLIDEGGVEELRRRLTVERPSSNGRRSATSLQYPLAINNMMTAALNMAAELGVPVVTRDVVRAV